MDRKVVARELGDFLRTRRERIAPPADWQRHRRTSGLRRNEVAELAGVSEEYYTKLEQGRALNPSPEILDAVSEALDLSMDEVAHLRDLATSLRAGWALKDGSEVEPEKVDARLVEAFKDRPAFVVDHRLDVIAWNALAATLLIDFGSLPPRQRNTTWLLFLNPAFQSQYVQWSDVARQNVAFLRASAGRHPEDERIVHLVGELTVRSALFAQWWASHDVEEKSEGVKVFTHPSAGQFSLHYDALQMPGPGDRHLVVYSPVDSAAEAALLMLEAVSVGMSVPSRATVDGRDPRLPY